MNQTELQYSVHPPSPFLRAHLNQLLPDWSLPAASVLLILQKRQSETLDRTGETETDKDRLREQFIKLGCNIARTLGKMGHQVDLFDPRTGWPLLSSPGEYQLDDVAVVCALLGYATNPKGSCATLLHPIWGRAVYPSTLLSSAPPTLVKSVSDDYLLYHTGLCISYVVEDRSAYSEPK